MTSKKIVILNQKNLQDKNFVIVKLKHPKSNELAPFLITALNEKESKIYELLTYRQEMGSMFIDEYVQSECAIYLSAKFNINYFLISYVTSLSKYEFESIDSFKNAFLEFLLGSKKSLIKDSNFPLNNLSFSVDTLEKMFDAKETSNGIQVRLNTTKIIDWLKDKCERLSTILENNAKNSTNITAKAKQTDEKDVNKFRLEAFELVSQYINNSLAGTLRKDLNLNSPLETNENKRAKPTITLD
jgi:hypothetical protein